MMRLLFCGALLAASSVLASSTATWEMNTFADFIRGRFEGLSLTRDGRLALGPKLEPLFATGQPALWSVAQAADGTLYAGTGHRGRVYRVNPTTGKGDVLWTAPEPEIFALTVGRDGALYAGTSPEGRVYRIERDGKATEYFRPPDSRYIWSLAFAPDGALYVGTGDNGRVWRVTRAGTGELWYESGQQHITALSVDAQGRVLAGSEPNGLLYRIAGKNQAFVLYDSAMPEIRTIAVAADGAVYVAALGGSVAQRTSAAQAPATTSSTTPQVTAPATSITVTDEGAAAANSQAGLDIKPKPPGDNAKTQVTATITPGTTVYTAAPAEVTGVEKSALYRINTDNTVETLWTSKEENLYDLLLAANNEVVFATDTHGRIYRLSPDRRLTLLLQTNSGDTTRLLSSGNSLIAASGTSGGLLRIGNGLASQGSYESPVHDAGSVAKWGQIAWRGDRAQTQGRLTFRARAGNSSRPDNTWSNWSEPVSDPAAAAPNVPNARFIQWRAELSGNGTVSPGVTGVTLSYLPQNNAPTVRSVSVVTQVVPATAASRTTSSTTSATAAYTVTVTDSTDTGTAGTPSQTVSRGLAQQIQITWQADDPDGDRLTYSVYFRGDEEVQWKPLKQNIAENIITLEGDVLADGKYFFRVVASDRSSNPAGSARDAEMLSPPVLFDNTPPTVRATARRENNRLIVEAEASDPSSALRRAEYSIDAQAWVPLDSVDGIVDGPVERFRFEINNVSAAEHVLVIRLFDASNNSGLTKVVVPAAVVQ